MEEVLIWANLSSTTRPRGLHAKRGASRIHALIGFLLASVIVWQLVRHFWHSSTSSSSGFAAPLGGSFFVPPTLIFIPTYSTQYVRYRDCLQNTISPVKPNTNTTQNSSSSSNSSSKSSQNIRKSSQNIRNSNTTLELEFDLFNRMPKLIERCQTSSKSIFDRLKFVTQGGNDHNNNQRQHFILPRPDLSKSSGGDWRSCRELTIGIGNHIEAELKFRDLHQPQCRFYGVEPVAEMGKIFRDKLGGKVFPDAVGWTSNETVEMTLLVGNEKDGNAGVHDVPVPMIPYPLHRFLREKLQPIFINDDQPLIIDHLWLDNEGPEWAMFEEYFKLLTAPNGLLLDPLSPWTICQINVEFHGPLDGRFGVVGGEQFDRLYQTLIQQGVYLPVVGIRHAHHHRAFLFNFGSEYCLNKYLWPINQTSSDE